MAPSAGSRCRPYVGGRRLDGRGQWDAGEQDAVVQPVAHQRIVEIHVPQQTGDADLHDLAVVARRALDEIAECLLLAVPGVVELGHVGGADEQEVDIGVLVCLAPGE